MAVIRPSRRPTVASSGYVISYLLWLPRLVSALLAPLGLWNVYAVESHVTASNAYFIGAKLFLTGAMHIQLGRSLFLWGQRKAKNN